jgi:hypothetical protein
MIEHFKTGDLVEYNAGFGEPQPNVKLRCIGIVLKKSEDSLDRDITGAIYQVFWGFANADDLAWYHEGQLILLSRSRSI